MLKARDLGLSEATLKHLKKQQSAIDLFQTYNARKTEMNRLWKKKKEDEGAAAFEEILGKIDEMSVGIGFCNYCEYDRISKVSIEHIYGKSSFPSHAFRWENFIGACPRCNMEEKGAEMWVFNPSGSAIPTKLGQSEPSSNDIVFIHPRSSEDPMDLMELDFDDFQFKAREEHPKLSREFHKVEKTNSVLGLDDDQLVRTRYIAFGDFLKALIEISDVEASSNFAELIGALKFLVVDESRPFNDEKSRLLAAMKSAILQRNHQTVLQEMIRRTDELRPEIAIAIEKSKVHEWGVWTT